MPNEDREKEKVKEEVESSKTKFFQNCSSGYSEVFLALLHLKVSHAHAYINLIL